jgi:hypothetical protein
MSNYSNFCVFFGIEEHKALKTNYEDLLKKYPMFKIPPVELVDHDMAITDNIFYNKAYAGSTPSGQLK